MNVNMYENPIFQENLSYLQKLGYKFVEPGVGELASGIVGKGRLAEPETIVGEVVKILTKEKDLEGKSIVVTASRTEEPLDPIRYLSNRSSGKMGYAIAQEAYERGAKVTLISGPSNLTPPSGLNFIPVRTAQEMLSAVRCAFKKADALIMASAVSDFSPTLISKEKIKKGRKEIVLKLRHTVDILKEMGKQKKEKVLVGFSLETEDEIKNAKKKLAEKNLDLIVVNNPNVPGAGFEVNTNQVTLIDKRGKIEKLPLLSKKEVAGKILDKVSLLLRKKKGRSA
jgi:phosphopantothenoylcysteine decarboxylase/phosphopantothenate--cysteine ligase